MAIQVSTNEKLIETRSRIGGYATIVGLAFMVGSVITSFQNDFVLAYGAMLVGLAFSFAGGYLLNRWALTGHKRISESLKGFDKRYRLYNYLLPVPNVLLTPYGVTVLLVKNQEGVIIGNAKGWQQRGGIVRFLRSFTAEPLGNPPKQLAAQEETMRQFLKENIPQGNQVPVDGYIVFTNDKALVTLSDVKAPVIVLNEQPDGLKNALRRDKRTPTLPADLYDQVAGLFERTAEEKASQARRGLRFWQR